MSDKQQRACELWLSNDAGFYETAREAALEAAREAFRRGADGGDDAAREAALEAVEGEVETVLEAVEEQIDEAMKRLGGLAADLASFDRRDIDTREVAECVVDIDDVVNEARELEDDGDTGGGDDFLNLVGDLWVHADNEGEALDALADIYAEHNGAAQAPWATWGDFAAWASRALEARGWSLAEGLRPLHPMEYRLHREGATLAGGCVWGIFATDTDGKTL